QAQVRHQAPQSAILFLDLPQLAQLRWQQPTVAPLPAVVRLFTDSKLAADLGDRRSTLTLLQGHGDLLFGESRLLHPEKSSFLERSNYANFLVLSGPVFREKTKCRAANQRIHVLIARSSALCGRRQAPIVTS